MLRRQGQELHGVQGLADVAAAAPGDVGGDAVLDEKGFVHFLLLGAEAAEYGALHLLRGDGLDLKDRGAAEDRVVDVEIGVLRGGGDEGDAAVLDVFQQGLLLLFVEILDLVQVEQDAVAADDGVQLLHDGLDVGQGGVGAV